MVDKPNRGPLSVWEGEDTYLAEGATQFPVVHSVRCPSSAEQKTLTFR